MAAEAYYQGSTEVMTDAEYDLKVEYLEALVASGRVELTEEIKSIINSVSAGTVAKGQLIKHDYAMLSLAKAKNESELKTYHTRLTTSGAKGFFLEMKLDGLALSAKYSSGILKQLATRGDGFEGESLNHLINSNEVSILGLPMNVGNNDTFEIRGEIYISDSQFKVINESRKKASEEEFSNPRNAVSGLVKRAEKGIGFNVEISFGAYSAYQEGSQIEFSKLSGMSDLITAEKLTSLELKKLSGKDYSKIDSVNFVDLMEIVEKFGKDREKFSIPTDGVVIKPVNEIEMLNKMGSTSHHPIAYIAYKYPGAKSISKVLEITVSVGKTGRLTPQAKIEPVEVDGVLISNVTCHNYSWLKEKGIKEGAVVEVFRANDVIPAISSVLIPGEGSEVEIPEVCPECGGEVKGGEIDVSTGVHKTISCTNDECPSRLYFYIKSIVGRKYLDIDGLGNVALTNLVEQEVLNGIVDLYTVEENVLAETITGETSTGKPRKLGAGNAKNIIKSIENSKKNTTSYKLLASLNIPGLGLSHSKNLIDKFGGIEEVLDLEISELSKVDGVGETLTSAFKSHRERAKETLAKLVEIGVEINNPEKKEKVESLGSFSVSGSVDGFSNRDEFIEHMESLGWEYHKSPKKTTDVLFADPEETSSKIKKAKENGTRIVEKLEDL